MSSTASPTTPNTIASSSPVNAGPSSSKSNSSNASRTGLPACPSLVGRPSACQSEQSSDASSLAPPPQNHSVRFPHPFHHNAVVAEALRSLRLCVEWVPHVSNPRSEEHTSELQSL